MLFRSSSFQFSGSNRININPGATAYSDWLAYSLDSTKTYFITMYFDNGVVPYMSSAADNMFYRNGDYSLIDWGPSGTADASVTTTNTKLTDTRLSLTPSAYIGAVITCNSKTMTVTSNDATSFTGASWSGGGNPGNAHAWSLGSFGVASSYAQGISAIQGWANGSGTGWDGDALITQWVTDWNTTYPLIWNNPFGTYYKLIALNQGQPLIATRATLITNRNPILSHYVVP